VDAVKKLEENWRPFLQLVWMAPESVTKFMSKALPFSLADSLETLQSAIMLVQANLGERAQLSCPIPAIRTVHQC
jgi:hypothetical protein